MKLKLKLKWSPFADDVDVHRIWWEVVGEKHQQGQKTPTMAEQTIQMFAESGETLLMENTNKGKQKNSDRSDMFVTTDEIRWSKKVRKLVFGMYFCCKNHDKNPLKED